MNREGSQSIVCEVCGGMHPSEYHWSKKIVARIEDTPHGPSIAELDDLRSSGKIIERAADGWDTLSALAKRLHRARESLDTLIAPLRSTHPEWFVVCRKAKAGSLAEHFHPDLIAYVERAIQELPPDNWYPATSFGSKITNIAGVTARIHPELVRPYVAPDGLVKGQLMLYYAPEFIASMQQWLQEMRRDFSSETTPEQLRVAFGLTTSRPIPDYHGGPDYMLDYWRPYGNAEKMREEQDRILAEFERDLVEDSHRQRRVRAAVLKTRRDIEEDRLRDEWGWS